MPLFITEFAQTSLDAQGRQVPSARMPFLRTTSVAVSGSSAASPVLLPETTLVRLHAVVNCCVALNTAGTAATTDMRLAAGQTEYVGVNPNNGLRFGVIASA